MRKNKIKKQMRKIQTHKVSPSDKIEITVTDAPGAGGANHRYEITGLDTENNPSAVDSQGYKHRYSRQVILFQNGTIPENGVNGVTQEVLLAIVQDRLEAFQAGPFACEENQKALDAVKEAQHWLQFRTLKRMARNVEGTHKV